MKKSELQQIIREEISRVLKENDVDLTKPYGVVQKGGPIGSGSKRSYIPQLNGEVIKTFDNIEDAKEFAKRYRSRLSSGEKSYYKMSYTVVKIPKNLKEEISKVINEVSQDPASNLLNLLAAPNFKRYMDSLSDVIGEKEFKKVYDLYTKLYTELKRYE